MILANSLLLWKYVMATPISNSTQAGVLKPRAGSIEEPQKAAPLEKAAKVEGLSKPTSEVSIDPNIKQALEAEHFDQSKVESIKAAIERGNYPLDDRKIAESFIPLEKLI